MKPRFLWLLFPVAAWLGYTSGPGHAAAKAAGAPEHAAEPTDPRIRALASSLEKAASAELAARLDALLAQPDSAEKDLELRLICARWAESDPAGALARFKAKEVPDTIRSRLLVEWALLDRDAAWAALAPGKEGDNDRFSITYGLLNEDPDAFMWWFRQVRTLTPNDNPAWKLVAERYGPELEEMGSALLGKPEVDSYSQNQASKLFALVAEVQAAKDPAGAFEWAYNLDPKVRNAALHAALKAWSDVDPQGVWKIVSRSDLRTSAPGALGYQAENIGQHILLQVAKQDPKAALKMITESPGSSAVFDLGGIDAMKDVLGPAVASGEMSALDAYRLVNSAKGQASNLGLNVFRKMWGSASPQVLEGALRDIMAEPDEGRRDTALGGIARSWLTKDPAGAMNFIGEIQDKQVRAMLYAGCFEGTNGSTLGARQQVELLANIPEADRAAVFAGYATQNRTDDDFNFASASRTSQSDRIAALLGTLPPSEDLDRAVAANAVQWAKIDPQAALAWADGLKDPSSRQAAYGGTFQEWARHDPYSAADWIADKPVSPERDAAMLPLVKMLVRTDAASAWEWAAAVSNPALKLEARTTALRGWAAQDPLQAQAAYQEIAPKLSKAEAAQLSESLSGK